MASMMQPSGMPSSQPQAPAWQTPGLGQTILESAIPTQPQVMMPQAPASMPMQAESFLPQRRGDGQIPFSGPISVGLSAPAQPAQPMWAGGFPTAPAPMGEMSPPVPRQGAGASGHSSLIPGAPTLPMLGGEAAQLGGSLMARGLPTAPHNPMAAAQTSPSPVTSGFVMPSSSLGGASTPSRPMRKPKRATNIFMIGLALLFLSGFLVAAGWLFREPVMQLVAKFTEASPEVVPVPEVITELKEPPVVVEKKEVEPSKAVPASDSKQVVQSPPSAPLPENPVPGDSVPLRPAEMPMPTGSGDVVEVRKPSPQAPGPLTPIPAPNPPTTSPLVEVPPKPDGKMVDASPDAAGGSTAATSIRLDDVTEEAKPAAEALKKFLQAGNLQERLKYTLAADLMRPIMERYYSNNPDGPILVDALALVRYDPKPQIGGGAHAVFGMESKVWEFPVPVMLEMSGGNFKVDWLCFVEFKDRLLEKLLQGYQEGAARFHVGMTRIHYFEDKVPNASNNKDAFRISPAPPNPFSSVVFVDRESDLGRELRDKIPWGAQVWAIAELEWAKLGSQSWVNLSAVPQLNWYSFPSAPKAQRGSPIETAPVADDAQVPTETQKAVPVGR